MLIARRLSLLAVAFSLATHLPAQAKANLGLFTDQTNVGDAQPAGSVTYDAATKTYTVASAGDDLWGAKDQFQFAWTKMSGDFSFSAETSFPDEGFERRKAFLMIRQTLDVDSPTVYAAHHGNNMLALQARDTKGGITHDMEINVGSRGSQGKIVSRPASRIGFEKHGDKITLLLSVDGGPFHPFGPPMEVHFTGPFYVGIGFCSHIEGTVNHGVFKNVELKKLGGN